MDQPSLLHLSGVAFLAVLIVLSGLSLLMAALVRIFPAAPSSKSSVPGALLGSAGSMPGPSGAEIAAIHGTLRHTYPHLTVTRIQVTEEG
jgi:hypothetical protein